MLKYSTTSARNNLSNLYLPPNFRENTCVTDGVRWPNFSGFFATRLPDFADTFQDVKSKLLEGFLKESIHSTTVLPKELWHDDWMLERSPHLIFDRICNTVLNDAIVPTVFSRRNNDPKYIESRLEWVKALANITLSRYVPLVKASELQLFKKYIAAWDTRYDKDKEILAKVVIDSPNMFGMFRSRDVSKVLNVQNCQAFIQRFKYKSLIIETFKIGKQVYYTLNLDGINISRSRAGIPPTYSSFSKFRERWKRWRANHFPVKAFESTYASKFEKYIRPCTSNMPPKGASHPKAIFTQTDLKQSVENAKGTYKVVGGRFTSVTLCLREEFLNGRASVQMLLPVRHLCGFELRSNKDGGGDRVQKLLLAEISTFDNGCLQYLAKLDVSNYGTWKSPHEFNGYLRALGVAEQDSNKLQGIPEMVASYIGENSAAPKSINNLPIASRMKTYCRKHGLCDRDGAINYRMLLSERWVERHRIQFAFAKGIRTPLAKLLI